MAYYGRRRGSSWPRILLVLILAGAAGFIFRHQIQAKAESAVARLTVLAVPTRHTITDNVLAAPTPTFTVAIDRPIPLAAVPAPEVAATTYLSAWSSGDYAAMYAMLSSAAKQRQSQADYVRRYQDLTREATIQSVASRVTSVPVVPLGAGDGASVQVPFTAEFSTIRVGTFQENNSVSLVLENGEWRVDWRPSLFFKDLGPNDLVHLFPLNPRRGSILDRKGRPLATMGFQETIWIVPKELRDGGHEDETLAQIAPYLHKSPDDLKKVYASQPPEWRIALGDVSGDLEAELQRKFASSQGVVLDRKPLRVYPQGEVGANVVGYIGHISDDELKTLAPRGYTIDDVVGRAGVEQQADQMLSGTRGGMLAIVAPSGEVNKVIARRDAVAGQDLVLGLDLDVQKGAEQVLGKLDGSVIVMNPQDNSVLALATYPRFDPNKFVTGFSPQEWAALNASPDKPFLDRPAEAVFATGSIFKVITMSAGMEALGYRPSDTFDCSYWWSGLPGLRLHNWTVQGRLNLIDALTGSCDPTFYTIGLALQRKDPTILPSFARGYGLGQKTGINGLIESAGTVPDPTWKQKALNLPWYPGDSINLAIGQGYLEATPLQMANAYSALAADGVRRSPLLIQKALDAQGNVVQTFPAQTLGRLPISPATLQAIHQGMLGVTSTPLGTAYYSFDTYQHPMEAKTGSAENQGPLAHAWFVGYAPPTNPTYLILVMVEGRGDSHGIAAPMARQLMDFLMPNDPAATPTPRTTATARPAASPSPTATPKPRSAATPSPTPKPTQVAGAASARPSR